MKPIDYFSPKLDRYSYVFSNQRNPFPEKDVYPPKLKLDANEKYVTPKYVPPDSDRYKEPQVTRYYLCIRPVSGSVHVDVIDDDDKPIRKEYNGSVGTSSTLYLNVSAQHRVRIRTFSSACKFKLLALTVWPLKNNYQRMALV